MSAPGPRRNRYAALAIVVAVAMIALGVGIGFLVGGGGTTNTAVTTPTTTAGAQAPTTTAPATPAPTAAAPPTTVPPSASPAVPVFRYEPLFPFASGAEVRAWQDAYRAGGHQPWHLDAAETARAFTTGFLGFHDVDRVLRVTRSGADAWVWVGHEADRRAFTAAIVHVARFGTGPLAPWEVAGTRDMRLTLTTPAYGARVSSPVPAGGTIMGVDESLTVRVLQLGTAQPLGSVAGVAAGGMHEPWSVPVPVSGARADRVQTVVVSTGGHVAEVEAFAVTAVHVAP